MASARWISSVCTLLPACLLAQQPGGEVKRMASVRTVNPPVIDGRLDDAVWSTAAVVEDLHQILPEEYAEPSERTTVYLLYDQNAVYIGARLWDSEPDQVTARILRQGEVVTPDDSFAIILSPFNDQRSGYFFGVNPNGVRVEGLYPDTTRLLMDWAGIWEVRTSVDNEGWIAEMAIPLQTLSFDPNSDVWGINFTRQVARKQEEIGWVSRNRAQNPSVSGVVEGFQGLQQGIGLDIVPSLSLRQFKQYSPENSRSDAEPSLDLFYKFNPAFTGVLTLNTDFSATEVDDRQVNLTRFSLFFPEKRDFFLQDADIFEFGRIGAFGGPDDNNGRPFFSRTIGLSPSLEPVDLEGGVKLSGRMGRWNLGVLGVHQDEFEDVEATNLFVGRLRANVLQESSLGMIVTDGDPDSNQDNSLVGIDLRYLNTRLPGGRSMEGDLWYQQSDSPGLESDDSAFQVSVSLNSEEGLSGFLTTKEIQENFRPALGFISRVGIRNIEGAAFYSIRPEDRFLRLIQAQLGLVRFERIVDGSIESEIVSLQPFRLENHTGDSIRLRLSANKEGLIKPFEISDGVVIPTGEYEFNRYALEIGTGDQRRWSGGLIYEAGDFFDGESIGLRPYLNWRPSAHFRLNIEYRMDDVDLPQGSFVTRLARLRTDIVFSSQLSWVNLFQWDNVTDTLGVNSRLHWIPQAGRDVFLVLNHNLMDIDGNRTFRSDFAELTLKFNYTFRF